eukprot:CAMPEP_0119411194 /NCGR_PEP_ID=MMETSP1335-20130426/4004_1 /TAXON_ID=259385 /ORGANISM="Chrysoculter rhomboideus, Strain RCC1486" /LENGTH=140 /DNA_ID=CAMNT_0007435803 /DNA_START=71 /DNA_END=494 /DNA_ORIENTATION=+
MSLAKLLTASPVVGARALSVASMPRTPAYLAGPAGRRALSIEDTIKAKERAEETIFFAKEEKALLKKLAKKLGKPEGQALDEEETAVKQILSKHGIAAASSAWMTSSTTSTRTRELPPLVEWQLRRARRKLSASPAVGSR